jgi:4-amino-4-deoxy-L-arabinose transferase-like glycosyltransferase
VIRRASVADAAVVVGSLVGIALRVWILQSRSGALDGDEAVWGLMARHFQHGHLTTFFWGQSYGGTEETLLTVPVLWLFGSSATAIRVVPMVLWAIAAVLVWRVGRRTIGDPRARIAATLFWTGSAFFVWKSTRAHGFYGSGLVLALTAVLLALRLRERDSRIEYALLGLVVGLGWWATPQTAILVLPAVLWLVAGRPAALRGAVVALPMFVLGSLPWWVFNLRHGFASLQPSADATSKPAHLHNLFSATLPTALGLRSPWSLAWFPATLVGAGLYAVLFAAFVYVLVQRPRGSGVWLLTVLIFPVLYTVSSYTWLNNEPRYLTLVFPALALLVALGATTPLRSVAIVAASIALAAAGLARIDNRNLAAPQADGVTVPSDFRPLLAQLSADRIDHVYANYWLAFPIAFESRERVVDATVADLSAQRYRVAGGRVLPIPGTSAGSEGRFPEYNRLVAASPRVAHVFVAGAQGEGRVRALFLSNRYRLQRAGGFDVYVPPV